MNEKEMSELNEWIAEHVMGWESTDRKAAGWGDGPAVWLTGDVNNPTFQGFYPTSNGGHAMKVLERCVESSTIAISKGSTGYWASDCDKKRRYATAETLPLAICLFAKTLFSK